MTDYKKTFDRVMIELYIAYNASYLVTRTNADKILAAHNCFNNAVWKGPECRVVWCFKNKLYVITPNNVNVKRQIFDGNAKYYMHAGDIPRTYAYDADNYITEM